MKKTILFIIILLLLENCSSINMNIIDISNHYKKYNDIKSLKKLIKFIKPGMSKEDVEQILGDPVYSPIEGQYYYSSNTISFRGSTIGVVLEYRKIIHNNNDIIITQTGKLESIYIGEIGE